MDTIFYSWQSDLPNSANRTFIERCLEQAIAGLRKEGRVSVDASLDRDTAGIPGSPEIAETIFHKIDKCSAFVADVSLINGWRQGQATSKGTCDCTRPTSNPNVLAEWGYAVAAIGMHRTLCVLNEESGAISDLPFDLSRRRIVTYRAIPNQDNSKERNNLTAKLKALLEPILNRPKAHERAEQFFAIVAGPWTLQWGDFGSVRRGVDKRLEFTRDGRYLYCQPNGTMTHNYDLTNIEYDPRTRKVSFDKVNTSANDPKRHPPGRLHTREILEISEDGKQMMGIVQSDNSPLRYTRL